MKDRYEWYKSKGICVQCGQKDAFPGYVKCPECIEKAEEASRKCWANKEKRIRYNKRGRERKRELISERKEKGLCPRCGKPIRNGTYIYCNRCRERKNAAGRAKRGQSPGEHFRERIDRGVCMFCGGEIVPGYRLCKSCLERCRDNFKKSMPKASEKWRKEIGAQWNAKQRSSGNG